MLKFERVENRKKACRKANQKEPKYNSILVLFYFYKLKALI